MKFPLYKQLDSMDCGPACLRMVAGYYGKKLSLEYIRTKSSFSKAGVSMLGLAEAARCIGIKTAGVKISFDELMRDVTLPAIVHWDQYHFVVVVPGSTANKLIVADPQKGMLKLNKEEFCHHWLSTKEKNTMKGTALLLEPTESFYKMDNESAAMQHNNFSTLQQLFSHIKDNKGYFLQVCLYLIAGSALQLILPYLTQSIVDTGIRTQDLSLIKLLLAAQVMLLFSQATVDFIRTRILLRISTRINISLLSGFWSKLLKLPLQFFDTKNPGDILQRLGDHHRIENFITGAALNTLFSLFNLVIFSFVLLRYNFYIFLVFFTGSILYLVWIRIFLTHRRKLDYKKFAAAARENDATMQLIYGMQEIKLNNAENAYRKTWETLQSALFTLNFKSLTLSQYQQAGAILINQGKNILITFIAAKLVIDGSLSLGMMLAIQYIIGQLSSPVEQLVGFVQQAQDARISLERLNDIQLLEDEEPLHKKMDQFIPADHSISISNLSFTYPGAGNEPVLKNINLTIPMGKVTAIVGMSGSGKTTLLKILLRFYENYKGTIHAGRMNFKTISPTFWRKQSGAVMQDSFIFNDTMLKNITVNDEPADTEKLLHACKTANLLSFIESLPLAFDTKMGTDGNGISGGQKQRLAIARAVYKNPQFLFFDEATNSLDAANEKSVLDNLQQFFCNRTVVIIAHRLSTVKNADKIVVLSNGRIAEEGTHEELTGKKGKYYELVKNQLALDK